MNSIGIILVILLMVIMAIITISKFVYGLDDQSCEIKVSDFPSTNYINEEDTITFVAKNSTGIRCNLTITFKDLVNNIKRELNKEESNNEQNQESIC